MTGQAVLIAVADAMAAEIAAAEQAAQFEGYEFTPVRSFADWEREIDDFGCLHVDCVPFNYDECQLSTRTTIGYLCSVSVVVRQRFAPDQRNDGGDIANEHVDRLILLLQELHEFFIGRRLAELPAAAWDDARIVAAYDYELLRSPGLFAGVLRVSYRVPKAIA